MGESIIFPIAGVCMPKGISKTIVTGAFDIAYNSPPASLGGHVTEDLNRRLGACVVGVDEVRAITLAFAGHENVGARSCWVAGCPDGG